MALKFGSTTIANTGTVKYNSTSLKSLKFGSTEVWKKGQTVTISKSSANGTAWKNVFWNTTVSGYTSVSITIKISGTQDIFTVGIGTSNPSGTDVAYTPANSLYVIKSVNGDKSGTYTKTLSISSGTTYYVYVGVYCASTSNNGSASITAVFS